MCLSESGLSLSVPPTQDPGRAVGYVNRRTGRAKSSEDNLGTGKGSSSGEGPVTRCGSRSGPKITRV